VLIRWRAQPSMVTSLREPCAGSSHALTRFAQARGPPAINALSTCPTAGRATSTPLWLPCAWPQLWLRHFLRWPRRCRCNCRGPARTLRAKGQHDIPGLRSGPLQRRRRAADRDFWVSPCLVCLKVPSFFTLSITSIFNRLHGVLNVGKKNN
jgi:hypothetical protein